MPFCGQKPQEPDSYDPWNHCIAFPHRVIFLFDSFRIACFQGDHGDVVKGFGCYHPKCAPAVWKMSVGLTFHGRFWCGPHPGVAGDSTLFTNFVPQCKMKPSKFGLADGANSGRPHVVAPAENIHIKSLVAQHPHTMTHMHSLVLIYTFADGEVSVDSDYISDLVEANKVRVGRAKRQKAKVPCLQPPLLTRRQQAMLLFHARDNRYAFPSMGHCIAHL